MRWEAVHSSVCPRHHVSTGDLPRAVRGCAPWTRMQNEDNSRERASAIDSWISRWSVSLSVPPSRGVETTRDVSPSAIPKKTRTRAGNEERNERVGSDLPSSHVNQVADCPTMWDLPMRMRTGPSHFRLSTPQGSTPSS